MSLAFDTNPLPSHRRFAHWQAAIGDLFIRLDVATDARESFQMKVQRWTLGPSMWAQNTCSQQVVRRTERNIAYDGEDLMVFLLANRGRSGVAQGEKDAVLHAGEFAMFDAARAYELAMDDSNMHTVLQVPRAMLTSRLGALERHTAATLSADRPIARLAFDFVVGVTNVADKLDEHAAAAVSDHALDLLAMALCERVEGNPADPSTYRAALLHRIKAVIHARLADPSLSLSSVAAELKISTRYINKLLADEETSFERYLLTCRLERCRRDLAAPYLAHRRIGEIAFAWGFNDAAHFSRTFKALYDMTPREWREAAALLEQS